MKTFQCTLQRGADEESGVQVGHDRGERSEKRKKKKEEKRKKKKKKRKKEKEKRKKEKKKKKTRCRATHCVKTWG